MREGRQADFGGGRAECFEVRRRGAHRVAHRGRHALAQRLGDEAHAQAAEVSGLYRIIVHQPRRVRQVAHLPHVCPLKARRTHAQLEWRRRAAATPGIQRRR